MLSELRDRLRAGDVWVMGSRRYRAFEERLISRETLKELERRGTLPIAVDADFERFTSVRRALLNERMTTIDAKAKGGLLPDVVIPGQEVDQDADLETDLRQIVAFYGAAVSWNGQSVGRRKP